MNPAPIIPLRPRLAEHAALRRHVVDGVDHLVIRDLRSDEQIEIDERQVEIVLCADGTRDLGGVVLEAVRRGVHRRTSEVVSLLADLQARGLLADGIEVGDPPAPGGAGDRPLEVLEGYSLTCDASGACCRGYDSILFARSDAERARGLVADVLSSKEDERRGFLPSQGSVPLHLLAVTMIDGRCPYLVDDGRCRIQLAADGEAKPLGCRIFPSTFVDDGLTVRVSVSVECPCVLSSVGVEGGAPLVPKGAKVADDLLPGSLVVRLPETVHLADEREVAREALHEWSRLIVEHAWALDDPLAAFWALADAVRDQGLSTEAAEAALACHEAPQPGVLGLPIMMISSALRSKKTASDAWRSPSDDDDLALLDWLVECAESLLDPSAVAAALSESPLELEHERFYLGATLFGHHLVTRDRSLEQELRHRSTVLLLARQLSRTPPPQGLAHPAAQYPLVVVEHTLRGQGLAGGMRLV